MNNKYQIALLLFLALCLLTGSLASSAEEPDTATPPPHSSPKVQVTTTDLPELPLELTSFGLVGVQLLWVFVGASSVFHSSVPLFFQVHEIY